MNRKAMALTIILIFFVMVQFVQSEESPHPLFHPVAHLQWYARYYPQALGQMTDFRQHKNLLISGALILPAAFLLDDWVNDFAYKEGLFPHRISRLGDMYGHYWGYMAATGGIIIESVVSRRSFTTGFERLQLAGESVLTGQILTEAIKRLTARERPNGNNRMSFPSGHTCGAFSLAASLEGIYGAVVGVPAYSIAVFVGLSRINDHNHYLSDVVAGALLGTLVGRSFSRQRHIEWGLILSGDSRGIILSHGF